MRLNSQVRFFPLSFSLLVAFIIAFHPSAAFADFEGSLRNVKSELSNVVLPLLSVIGLLMAAFSYLTGNQNAKQHITYALIGAAVGFGSQAIIDFISSTIH
jgi:ABC-type Fe3+-siderophore transport system permease subunit